MSIAIATGTAPSRYEHLEVARAAPQEVTRRERPSGDDEVRRKRVAFDGPGAHNPLVAALTQALKGLLTPAAAPTAPTPVAAPAAAAPGALPAAPDAADSTPTEAAGDLREAAYAFAHELFSALRGAARNADDDGDSGHHHGHGHGRHLGWARHGHHGDDRGDFGGLVQRLQTLARALDAPAAGAAAAATPPAASVAEPAGSPAPQVPLPSAAADAPSLAPVPEPMPGLPPTAAAPMSASSVEIQLGIDIRMKLELPGAPGAPGEPADSPLLSAFKQLMDRLNPGSADAAGTGTEATTPAARLKSFLLGIAEALQTGASADAAVRPPLGGLLNLVA